MTRKTNWYSLCEFWDRIFVPSIVDLVPRSHCSVNFLSFFIWMDDIESLNEGNAEKSLIHWKKEVPKGEEKKNESKGNKIKYWCCTLFHCELGNCHCKLFENCGCSWCDKYYIISCCLLNFVILELEDSRNGFGLLVFSETWFFIAYI
jgi:hypothetical protein